MELDILFLGRLFPREFEQSIKQKMKRGMSDAANALQWNIIDGLEENDCGKIRILNCLPVDSFPKAYADLWIPRFPFSHTDKYPTDDWNIGHLNLTGIKQFVNILPFKKHVRKWAKEKTGAPKILMMYSAHPMSLKLVKYAKKFNKDIQAVCVIADIPEYNILTDLKGVRKLYNDHEIRLCDRLYGNIDMFVLLTDQMADKLRIKTAYTVMEGIAPEMDEAVDPDLAQQYKNEKYILYSGTLNYRFGIGTLLEAFEKMDAPDVKLVICGFGEAEEMIRKSQDPRIVFLGKVDRKAVLPLQRGATVLVNPRQNNEEFTKYSFPSKTMEYLAAGVPVVAYKLDGIPDEYDTYLNYVEDNSAESLAAKLTEICNMDEAARAEMGKRGAQFVLQNKNAVAQTRRILELIR